MIETYSVAEWRKAGAFTPNNKPVPKTSLGRRVEITASRPPRKGETFLKPSGKKGVSLVLVAQNDHKKTSRLILRIK